MYYEFQNVTDGTYKSIYFHHSKAPSIGSVIEYEGQQWKRVASTVHASIDTKFDPNSKSDFIKVTNKRGSTFGNMFDLSKEFSAMREEKNGVDEVRNDHENKHEKDGFIHPEKQKRKAREKLKKLGIKMKNK